LLQDDFAQQFAKEDDRCLQHFRGAFNSLGRRPDGNMCLHVSLPVRPCLKWLPNLSLWEQPLLSVLDVFSVGWVGIRPSQGAAAEMLPKMTHGPAYPPEHWGAHCKQDQIMLKLLHEMCFWRSDKKYHVLNTITTFKLFNET